MDYDEISDEHRSEKASEKSESKPDKSVSQALGNNYYVLTQDQEQCPEWKNCGKVEVSLADRIIMSLSQLMKLTFSSCIRHRLYCGKIMRVYIPANVFFFTLSL